ncbi:hypothetical protein ANN_13820 [Periplaneta americana]|uniref:Reverse transcriptase domain-containing protein n=1 Tax=Periplaneta americana TaxID=6978 RepID=A0ABQ8SVY3_PERAM|nr:hypothetical protein ANN_13820 [Periplaneta americana]
MKIGENPQTIRENAEILLEASKAMRLEVNPEKTKYMIMSRDQNVVRNGTIKSGDLSFNEVEKFKYLGATVTNINDTREEIERRINMGNACYYSVEKLLSSSLLSKNLKEDKSPSLFPPHSTLEAGPWMGGVKPDQTTRPDELCLSYNVLSATSKAREDTRNAEADPARAILASGINFTAKQLVQVKSASGDIGMECRGKTQLPHRSLEAQISTCAHRLKYTTDRTHLLSFSSDKGNSYAASPPHATFSPTPTLANQNAKPHCQAEVEIQSISKRLKLLPLYELKRSRKTLLSHETVLVSSRYLLLFLQNCLQLPLLARRLNLVEL